MKRPEEILGDQILRLVHYTLSKVIKPDITLDKVTDLSADELEKIKRKYGIEAIILDVDDTLRAETDMIPKANREWIESLRGKVKIIILSNGIDKNIEKYFSDIGIDYIGFAHKPFKMNFVKACQRLGVKPENVLMVGNSLFDDIYGGQRNNMKTALVKNVEEHEL